VRWLLLFGVAAVGAGATASAVAFWPIGEAQDRIDLAGDAGRGAYLARASGCIACHTTFSEGGAPLAGGVELATPFGTFYSPNLTTDPDHGIGDWAIEEFAVAVRQGVGPDGEPYYPTFTYPFYGDFSDQDIADLWAAFQTVPAVAEASPEHEVNFPFNMRWGLKLWRAAFLDDPQTEPVEGRDDIWNRGRELARGAAHCGACHTGRNIVGARIETAFYAGNDELPGGDHAPCIRLEHLTEQGWTVDALVYALETGITPSGDVFGGGMGEVVQYGTRFLTPEDRLAIATYIMDPDETDPSQRE
jgi:mono/diheme cytochrome c family protein